MPGAVLAAGAGSVVKVEGVDGDKSNLAADVAGNRFCPLLETLVNFGVHQLAAIVDYGIAFVAGKGGGRQAVASAGWPVVKQAAEMGEQFPVACPSAAGAAFPFAVGVGDSLHTVAAVGFNVG